MRFWLKLSLLPRFAPRVATVIEAQAARDDPRLRGAARRAATSSRSSRGASCTGCANGLGVWVLARGVRPRALAGRRVRDDGPGRGRHHAAELARPRRPVPVVHAARPVALPRPARGDRASSTALYAHGARVRDRAPPACRSPGTSRCGALGLATPWVSFHDLRLARRERCRVRGRRGELAPRGELATIARDASRLAASSLVLARSRRRRAARRARRRRSRTRATRRGRPPCGSSGRRAGSRSSRRTPTPATSCSSSTTTSKTFRGSLEVIDGRRGRPHARALRDARSRIGPTWVEIEMLTRLERKLRAELGTPAPAPTRRTSRQGRQGRAEDPDAPKPDAAEGRRRRRADATRRSTAASPRC